MIDFDEKDLVVTRRTADGERFALFLNSDVQPFWGQKFWTAVLDTGGDGFGLQVRYGTGCTAPSGWTVRQLICVVQARMALEHARMPDAGALAVLEALVQAVTLMPEGEEVGSGVSFEPGWQDSPYRWTFARGRFLPAALRRSGQPRGWYHAGVVVDCDRRGVARLD